MVLRDDQKKIEKVTVVLVPVQVDMKMKYGSINYFLTLFGLVFLLEHVSILRYIEYGIEHVGCFLAIFRN